jgi:hypothetical protein
MAGQECLKGKYYFPGSSWDLNSSLSDSHIHESFLLSQDAFWVGGIPVSK